MQWRRRGRDLVKLFEVLPVSCAPCHPIVMFLDVDVAGLAVNFIALP